MNIEELQDAMYKVRGLEAKRIRCIYFHPQKLSEFLASIGPKDPLVATKEGSTFGGVSIKEEKLLPINPGYFIEYYE